MSEITPNLVNTTAAGRVPAPSQSVVRAAEASEHTRAPQKRSDQVELSDRARLLSKLRETPEVRQDLVDRVRAEIDSGEYLTSDKLEAATDNVLSDLNAFG